MTGKRRALNRREGEVLVCVVGMVEEFGPEVDFTRGAIELVFGSPVAGSLAGLTMLGYMTQRTSPEGLVYKLTEGGAHVATQILRGRAPKRVNGHDRGRS